jgi:hypothetical protein
MTLKKGDKPKFAPFFCFITLLLYYFITLLLYYFTIQITQSGRHKLASKELVSKVIKLKRLPKL